MIRFLLAASLVLSGCASTYDPKKLDLQKYAAKSRDALTFAFQYGDEQYFFAPAQFVKGSSECYLYLGYKGDELKFAFDHIVYRDLEKVYEANSTPESVKKGILDRIQSESANDKRCEELGTKTRFEGPGQGAIGIVFLPLAVPFLAYALLVDYPNERWQYTRVSDELRLGRKLEDFPDWFKKELKANKKGNYTLHEFVQKRFKTILYFENGKLDAWTLVPTTPF